MITKFEFFLNEDVAKAKSILTKMKDKVPLGEKDPDYLKIREMLKGKDGYVGLFTKLFYEDGIPLDSLKNLLNDIQRYKEYLQFLPKPITQYDDFEKIYDDLRNLESQKYVNYWLREMPANLKNDYKNTDDDVKKTFSNVVNSWSKLDAETRESIYRLFFGKSGVTGKISSFKDFKTFSDDFSVKVNSASGGFEYEKVLKHIKNTSAQIVYEDYDKQIIAAFIPDKKTSKELGKDSSWCISYQDDFRNRWDSYNSLENMSKQYFIWNFNYPFSDDKCMIALTIDSEGKVSYIHEKDDYSIMSTYQEYFKKWKIPGRVFTPLSKTEIKYRKNLIVYDKILKSSYELDKVSVKEFWKMIKFFKDFDWSDHKDCVDYILEKKLNKEFYNLIQEKKIDIPQLISDGLVVWSLYARNFEIFYYLLDNYDLKDVNSSKVLEWFVSQSAEEQTILEKITYVISKLPKHKLFIEVRNKGEEDEHEQFDIPRGFFDAIIERDWLDVFKLFWDKIPEQFRNEKIYYPDRYAGSDDRFTAFVNWCLTSASDEKGIRKPTKILRFLINNGGLNSTDLFIYCYNNHKDLYEKLIENSYKHNNLSDIYSELMRDENGSLCKDIITDLLNKNMFSISFYIETKVLQNHIKSTIDSNTDEPKRKQKNEDFIYLIDLLIKYVNSGQLIKSDLLKEIFKESTGGYYSSRHETKYVYKELLKLSQEKVYPLLRYFPKDSVQDVSQNFIAKNDLSGLKKYFDDYKFDVHKLNQNSLLAPNAEFTKYFITKKPFKSINDDILVKFNEVHPELLDSLLDMVNYQVSNLYQMEKFELFKKVIDTKKDYSKPENIYYFKCKNINYAIDNKNLKLTPNSLGEAIEYGKLPDNPYGVETAKNMIKAGCKINYKKYDFSSDEDSVLFLALKKGNLHILRFLIDEYKQNPYDLKVKDSYSWQNRENQVFEPMRYAIESKNYLMVEYLIDKYKKPIQNSIKWFVNTHMDKQHCKGMSDLILKYIKPEYLKDDEKVDLVIKYNYDLDSFVKLFNYFNPDATETLKDYTAKYGSRNDENEYKIIKFLDEKGADIPSIYEEFKRNKRFSETAREYFKAVVKEKNRGRKESFVDDFEFFQDFIGEKNNNNNKMKYLKEFNEFFSGGTTEAPVKTPTKTPNPTKRPSPIRRDKPTITPKPKASIDDVLKRIKQEMNKDLIKTIKKKYD